MTMRTLLILAAIIGFSASAFAQTGAPKVCGKQLKQVKPRAAMAQRHKNYDAKQLGQCVDVCKACMNGNNVTCNTSCKLKSAT
jgi:hypothetical protein